MACDVGLYPPSVKVAAEVVQTETAMQQAMAAIALIGNNTAMHPMGQSSPMAPRGQVVLLTLLFACVHDRSIQTALVIYCVA